MFALRSTRPALFPIVLLLRIAPRCADAAATAIFSCFGINRFAIRLKFCAVAANKNSS